MRVSSYVNVQRIIDFVGIIGYNYFCQGKYTLCV